MCAGLQPRQTGTRAKTADHPWVFWGPVWPSELNKTGFGAGEGVQGAGREAQRLRREGTEPPGG